MALYDKASLVLIPSGTKAGTVFSQKPTSGDGDFDFTRSTYATRVNSQGLIEKERSNLLLQSNNFDTTWGTLNLNTPTNGFSGYDGSSDAWKIEANASNFARINQSFNLTGLYTASIYAKKAEYNYIGLYFDGVDRGVMFSLIDGTVVNSIINYPDIYADAEDVGNGWYRISIAHTLSGSGEFRVYPSETTSHSGNTTYNAGVYIQDAQLEQGLVVTDYIETTSSAVYTGITDNVPRLDYDGDCPSLLLEPQRQNLFNRSEHFASTASWNTAAVTTTVGQISPSGDNSASLVEVTSGGGNFLRTAVISLDANTTYTASWYFKNVSLTSSPTYRIETFSGGGTGAVNIDTNINYGTMSTDVFQRKSITFTTGDASGSYRVRIFGSTSAQENNTCILWGAQLEEGSYATSYIPTYGTTVTRNAEQTFYTQSNLISTQSFTLFFEHKALGASTSSNLIYSLIVDGGDNIALWSNNANGLNVYLYSNGAYIFGTNSNDGFTAGSNSKVALTYDGDRLAYFVNGSLYNSTTNVSFYNAQNYIYMRAGSASIEQKQVLAFPTALTDDECIALTTL